MRSALRRVAQIEAADQATLLSIAGRRATATARRILAFSGSFNPQTVAHTGLVQTALATGFDAALWMLPVSAVDKERVERAALADRLTQLRLYMQATNRNALALVNRGLYYEQAAMLCDRHPGAEISILVGFDKVVQIFDAHYYQDRDAALRALFSHAGLLVAPRTGAGAADLRALLSRPENAQFTSRVTYLSVGEELSNNSSTEARALASSGRNDLARNLVTPEGMALVHLGAYSGPATAASASDSYEQRLAWLRTLA